MPLRKFRRAYKPMPYNKVCQRQEPVGFNAAIRCSRVLQWSTGREKLPVALADRSLVTHTCPNGQYPRLSQQFRSKTLDRAPFVSYIYLVG